MPSACIATFPFLLLCFFHGTNASAQRGTVAAGGEASGFGGTVSYSIGQLDFISPVGTAGSMSEGLQQPYEIYIVSSIDENDAQLTAVVYPNPTSDEVILDCSGMLVGSLVCLLTDAQGKVISRQAILTSRTKISIAGLCSGAYLLNVLRENKPVKSFRIIKNP